MSRWDRKMFSNDPFGRNVYGTPPQKKADYAFIQHIVCSLNKNGRAAILLPHGILASESECEIREKLVKDDQLTCIMGLAKDMFYNSPMRACVMIFEARKTTRKNKVLFINAEDMFERKKNKNFLNQKHINKISKIYNSFETIPHRSYVATNNEILENNSLLNISLYVRQEVTGGETDLETAIRRWHTSSGKLSQNLLTHFKTLET